MEKIVAHHESVSFNIAHHAMISPGGTTIFLYALISPLIFLYSLPALVQIYNVQTNNNVQVGNG